MYEEVIRDTNIDAVAIATPAQTHSAIAKKALLAGKHMFVLILNDCRRWY